MLCDRFRSRSLIRLMSEESLLGINTIFVYCGYLDILLPMAVWGCVLYKATFSESEHHIRLYRFSFARKYHIGRHERNESNFSLSWVFIFFVVINSSTTTVTWALLHVRTLLDVPSDKTESQEHSLPKSTPFPAGNALTLMLLIQTPFRYHF